MHKLLDKIKKKLNIFGGFFDRNEVKSWIESMIYLGMKQNVINQEVENLLFYQLRLQNYVFGYQVSVDNEKDF